MRKKIRAWLARFAAEAATLDQPLDVHRTTVQAGGRTFLLVGMQAGSDWLTLDFRDKEKYLAERTICRKGTCPLAGLHTVADHDG